jgi:ATP-binding cassette subfamily B protein
MLPNRESSPPVGLRAQFWRHSPRYAAGVLLLGLYQYTQWWFDTTLMDATNRAVSGNSERALQLGLGLAVVALVAFGLRVASRLVVFNAGRQAEYELRQGLLTKLQSLGPSFYRRVSAGEVMSRATNDLTQVRLLLGFGVLNVISTPFALVSSLAVVFPISWKLTLSSLGVVPLLLLVMRFYARSIFTRTRENQDALGKLSEAVQTSVAGVRVVRSFGLETRETERFEQVNQSYLEKNLSLARLRGALGPMIYAITSTGFLVVFWYGSHLLLTGEIDEGGLIAFLRALGRITWPIISLGFVISIVQRGRASYSRLAEVFESEPDVTDGKLAPPPPSGRIEVRDLTWGYDGTPVLKNVSFALEPGRSLAVVGRTGAGKTTLALLLARLQPTPRGTVLLDGEDVCDLPLHHVRSVVGYAEQTAFLFSTTAGRNIGYALEDPDSDSALAVIERSADEARVLEELKRLPDGIDTIVGERGVQLSGGQRQRVALARAFVGAPRVLVLDDPLSAVDAETESRILEAIDRQRAQRGVILITHRVAAAARCDHVLVLDHGEVVAYGTHPELLERDGLYARFCEEQRIASELERLAKEDGASPGEASRASAAGAA